MAAIELLSTRIESSAGTERLVGKVQLPDGRRREIFFGVAPEHRAMLHDAGDPFLPALLVPAMAHGVDLRFRPPVSERLLGQLETAQDILVRFHSFRRATVSATARPGGEPPPATAAQFSGGVDSTFTLLRSRQRAIPGTPPAEYLLFFKGLEQPLSALRNVEASIAAVARVAARTGTRLLVVETNLRDVFDPNYERYYCGAALASASLALACGIGTVLVPASQDYGWLEPWGSHPMLDVLWSSERLRIVFAGVESRRVDKVEALVREWPESLQWLRVCLSNSGGGSNCGRCRKCARTMAALAALGALDRAPLFPALSRQGWRALRADDPSLISEIAELAHRVSPGSTVASEVDRALAATRRRTALRTLLENTPVVAPAFAGATRLKRGLRHLLRGGPPEEELRVVRRLRRLREVARRHGPAAAVRWGWESRSPHGSTLLFFGLTRTPELPPPSPALQACLATPEEVQQLTDTGELDPGSPERIAGGDACLLQFAGTRLVGWAWLATRAEVELVEGVVLTLPAEAGYVYGTWTVPEARGQGLQPQRTRVLLEESRRRGRERLLCFVDATNLASLKGVSKAGYRRVARLRLTRASAVQRARLRIESPEWSGIAVRLSPRSAGS